MYKPRKKNIVAFMCEMVVQGMLAQKTNSCKNVLKPLSLPITDHRKALGLSHSKMKW